jgi:hypothetical protein
MCVEPAELVIGLRIFESAGSWQRRSSTPTLETAFGARFPWAIPMAA